MMTCNAKKQPSGLVRDEATTAARTLRELGLPRDLASDLEATFRAMGLVEGLEVVGYSFVTPDGVRHRLRVESDTPGPALDRAA